MAGASFKMDMSGMMRSFGSAVAHLTETKELMDEIGEMLVSSTKERFENGEGPDGTSWKPSERAKNEGGQTLLQTGTHLRSTITHDAGDDYVVVGTPNETFGAIHQFGGEIVPKGGGRLVFQAGGKTVFAKKVTIPARPYIGMSDDDMEEAKDMVVRFVQTAFKR